MKSFLASSIARNRRALGSFLLSSIAAIAPLAGSASAQTYLYDAGGRLTQTTYADGTTISYAYDAAGNITKIETTPQPPSSGGGGGGGGCFIATAAYGSPMHPHVQALRDFRDDRLRSSPAGRAFIGWYGRVSPPIAAVIAEHGWLRAPVRWLLTPLVYAVAFPRTALVVTAVLLAAFSRAWRRRRRLEALARIGPTAA